MNLQALDGGFGDRQARAELRRDFIRREAALRQPND